MKISNILEKLKKREVEDDEFEKEIERIKESWPKKQAQKGARIPKSPQREVKEEEPGPQGQDQEKVRAPKREPSQRTEEQIQPDPEVTKKEKTQDIDLKSTGKNLNYTIKDLKKEVNTLSQKFDKNTIQQKKEEEEIPSRLKNWIRENLKEGFTPKQLKESLKKSGKDPGWVDKYLSNN